LDHLDKRILNSLQRAVPLVPRPFAALGAGLGMSETDVVSRIQALKSRHIIRQISAIFDTRSLGYDSSLVAMRVRPDRLDAAAAMVSDHPGVSHNYQRNHAFNLWFTLAVPTASDLTWTVERLHEMAGAESTRMLPTLRLFKIGVQLDMAGGDGTARDEVAYNDDRRPAAGRAGLGDQEIALIQELQNDLPLIPEPFAAIAGRLTMDQPEVFARAARLQAEGYLRRFAAVLHHREAGFAANAMGVWVVSPDRAEEIGAVMGSFRGVSHCYLRPTYPDWPYNIFTMVHGHTQMDCEAVVGAIAQTTGMREYALLYSTKQYKKIRLRYFTPDIAEWEARIRHRLAQPVPLAAPS
jgi:DNA-binding Lrp family transcriptional regulator